MQLIEDVEEFFLGFLLAAEELHVVDDDQIDLPVEAREVGDPIFLDGSDELRGELLARYIEDAVELAALRNAVSDGLNDVCLPEADAAVDHEGVEARAARVFRDGVRRAASEAVAIALDEGFEGVLRLQSGFVDPVRLRRSRHRPAPGWNRRRRARERSGRGYAAGWRAVRGSTEGRPAVPCRRALARRALGRTGGARRRGVSLGRMRAPQVIMERGRRRQLIGFARNDLIGDTGVLADDIGRHLLDHVRVVGFEPFSMERIGNGEPERGRLVMPL